MTGGALKSAIVDGAWFLAGRVAAGCKSSNGSAGSLILRYPCRPAWPSPDYIFSILREPWHAAPFVNRHTFVSFLAPGFASLCGGMPRRRSRGGWGTADGRTLCGRTARWASPFLLIYLFAALVLFLYLPAEWDSWKILPRSGPFLRCLLVIWLATGAGMVERTRGRGAPRS